MTKCNAESDADEQGGIVCLRNDPRHVMKALDGCQVLSVDLSPETIVHHLKLTLAPIIGVPPLKQRLILGTQVLQSNYILGEWIFEEAACLSLVLLNSRMILTGGSLGNYIHGGAKLWNLETGQCMHEYAQGSKVLDASFSPDFTQVIFALHARGECEAQIWDLETVDMVRRFRGHLSEVNTACFSKDGKLVLTSSEDGSARAWEIDSSRCIHQFYYCMTARRINGASFGARSSVVHLIAKLHMCKCTQIGIAKALL